MTTIATQTNNEVTELFRFRDVAEEYNTSHAVNDGLMSKIEDGLETIKKLEETLAEKNKIIKEYQSVETDFANGEITGSVVNWAVGESSGSEFLREALEGMGQDRENAEDESAEWEERVDELQERVDELETNYSACHTAKEWIRDENEVNKKNMFKFMKENEKLKEEIGRYDKSRDAWMETADERHGEITKLKEEIKELKEENEKWEADDDNLTKVMSMVSNELDEDEYAPWTSVDDIYDIVKKLKEELKVWESDEDVVMNCAGMYLYEETKKENEKEEIKTMLCQ